jgi:hypothetical protein
MKTHLKMLKLISFHTHESRVIRKVRKTQYQNPEFGHTQGEIKKKPAKKYINIQQGMQLRKPSFFGDKLFTANCTTTIISLEPCALNDEFLHLILSCSISY